MDEEGVEEGQRGLQGGSSQGLPMVESEAKEYTLQMENLLNECGQAHNAHNTCTRGDDDKDLKIFVSCFACEKSEIILLSYIIVFARFNISTHHDLVCMLNERNHSLDDSSIFAGFKFPIHNHSFA